MAVTSMLGEKKLNQNQNQIKTEAFLLNFYPAVHPLPEQTAAGVLGLRALSSVSAVTARLRLVVAAPLTKQRATPLGRGASATSEAGMAPRVEAEAGREARTFLSASRQLKPRTRHRHSCPSFLLADGTCLLVLVPDVAEGRALVGVLNLVEGLDLSTVNLGLLLLLLADRGASIVGLFSFACRAARIFASASMASEDILPLCPWTRLLARSC